MYRAVVFDFDGTIIDTEQHLFQIINNHLTGNGLDPISVDYYRQSIGGAATELHNYLEAQLGLEKKSAIYQEHNETSVNLPINKEVEALMKYCKQRHIPMAIATSSYRKDIEPTFKRLGLEQYMDIIVGREDVDEVKPNPELYLTAVQQLNYNPVNCLAIEDSVNGATAAINAGLDVIINTNRMTELQPFQTLNFTAKDVTANEIIEHYFEQRGSK
ncbi:HAD family hydrolase [Staphylococcus gallinarum]|uniref:Haloacid dehalogenase n=1 Tax=Staphylococcus gallinarum TaxID=1293 RepID=A0ABQ0Y2W8_STAGA|nr:HAD family hydrolase [Staphylococcus gallinarum]KIR11298.1 HAD family hydrolase [Staphylococcus gallinarum]MCD8910498.1 HAD family hydrolase [Staphylococcus gallinarum]MCD8920458.1 HAD family hydrolase [Staphylococcus gallinarum]MEB6278420.1 HAD family hydrolase [Staphylococcus gallinarum]MEB7039420.1 HAD family hydrolase [Staphylococcus gallinarum]